MTRANKHFEEWLAQDLEKVARQLEGKLHNTCSLCSIAGKIGMSTRNEVYAALDYLLESLFPGCYSRVNIDPKSIDAFVEGRLRYAATLLIGLVENACRFGKEEHGGLEDDWAEKACAAVRKLIEEMPEVHSMLMADLQAAYEGDPAARSVTEVVISYPFVEAIATHRIAYSLYSSGVQFLPRMMSERAHSNTGIDIHPGAKIGKGFFIDHGTGVVIGETAVIGDHENLSRRHFGRVELSERRTRPAHQGRQTSPEHRRQCDHLCPSHHSRRANHGRASFRHRRQRLAHQIGAALQ